MAVQILIPTPLRRFTDNQAVVEVPAGTIGSALSAVFTQYPGIKERICEESGALRRYVNVYYKGEDIRFLDNLDTRIDDGTEVSIVPAIAGG